MHRGAKTTVIVLLNNNLSLIAIATPLGQMIGGATDEGVCFCEFNENPLSEFNYKSFSQFFEIETSQTLNPHLKTLKIQLDEYFEGKRKEFSIPIAVRGTDFQHKVWAQLQHIPCGTTQTYKQQSKNLNQPLAIRAMAHANGQNPIAIMIPCHRVIGTNGKLTGYAGGLWRKKWLLEHERNNCPLNGTLF